MHICILSKPEVLLIINFGVGLHICLLARAHGVRLFDYKLPRFGPSLSNCQLASYTREIEDRGDRIMAIGLAALATLLLLGSFSWRETRSQVTNINRPECDGIFDFYFLLDRYVHAHIIEVCVVDC